MRNDKPNVIVDKTFQYALKVLDYAEKLYEVKRFALADRLYGQVFIFKTLPRSGRNNSRPARNRTNSVRYNRQRQKMEK